MSNCKEIIDFINKGEYDLTFGWVNKMTYGLINLEKKVIIINIKLFIASTVIHEFYHHKYPNLKEVEVEELTDNKIKSLTIREITYLAELFAKNSDT